jgi:hypothetical protein
VSDSGKDKVQYATREWVAYRKRLKTEEEAKEM